MISLDAISSEASNCFMNLVDSGSIVIWFAQLFVYMTIKSWLIISLN